MEPKSHNHSIGSFFGNAIGDQVAASGGRCQVTPERAAQLVGYIPFQEQRVATVSVATDTQASVR